MGGGRRLAASDPVEDYLVALGLFERVAGGVEVVVPGHGSTGDAGQLRERIARDRAYVEALRDGSDADDPRLRPPAPHAEWLPGVDEWQRQRVAGASPTVPAG
ncbi:MAG TPA: hypothetical protein VNL94_06095 [Candidatus Binatia bacterium]|nr:hypothetical protein [Candidatus Binatia bacterium]